MFKLLLFAYLDGLSTFLQLSLSPVLVTGSTYGRLVARCAIYVTEFLIKISYYSLILVVIH